MRSQLLWRRSAAAAGIYSAAAFGFLGTVVATHTLGDGFALFAIAFAAAGFFQTLMDLTVEDAIVKYGFRYVTQERWGKLRRLLERALLLKLAGGLVGGICLVVLAPFADRVFHAHGLTVPMLVIALLPLVQAPENVGGSALILQGRYDVRGGFYALSMALRLTAIGVGGSHGLTATLVLVVVAQAIATAAVSAGGWAAFRRFPRAAPEPLGSDRRDILRFVVRSSIATGVVSMRSPLGPLLLGVVAVPRQVALFRVAQAPQGGLASLSAPARLVLLAEQTRDWERGARSTVFRGVARYTIGASVLMGFVVPPLLWFMPAIVGFVYPDRYGAAVGAARLILLAAAVQFVVGWTKSLPTSIGRPGLRILTHGVETVVLVPLVVVLGSAWGAAGAAGAVLASTLCFAALWGVLLLRLRNEPPAALAPPPAPSEVLVP